jgi:hypothetical protein
LLQHNALGKLNTNRKENAMQQKTGVDRTHVMDGLFPYGKLVKKLHSDALKQELLFRLCTEEEVNGWNITQCKNKLKELETMRVGAEDATAMAAATKAFKPLSGAVFPVA